MMLQNIFNFFKKPSIQTVLGNFTKEAKLKRPDNQTPVVNADLQTFIDRHNVTLHSYSISPIQHLDSINFAREFMLNPRQTVGLNLTILLKDEDPSKIRTVEGTFKNYTFTDLGQLEITLYKKGWNPSIKNPETIRLLASDIESVSF